MNTPAIHRIENGKFVCSAEPTAKCHTYPDCGCEQWSRELHGQKFGEFIGRSSSGHLLFADKDIPPAPGHENIQQDAGWIKPWLQATDPRERYGATEQTVRSNDEFPDGEIDYEWHGDYLTWFYADQSINVGLDFGEATA